MISLVVIILLGALPIFIIGLFIRQGKGLMLLSGYNTMPKEERDKIDKKELSKKAGNLMLRLSLYFALLGVAIYLEITWVGVLLLLVIIIDPCFFTIMMYGKNKKSKSVIVIIIDLFPNL